MRNKIKRIFLMLVCGIMCFSIFACGNTDKVNPPNGKEPAGEKTELPDYDIKEEELKMNIGGWVIPKDLTDTQIDYIKESGISVLQLAEAGEHTLSIRFTSPLDESKRALLTKLDNNGLKVLLPIAGKDTEKIANAALVAEYPAVMGLGIDEPTKDLINKVAAQVDNFNKTARDKSLFVNLFPSFASEVTTEFDDYRAYLTYYCDKVLKNLNVGEKWLSADRYPLVYDGKSQPCLDVGWLSDVEAVASVARKYEDVKTNFFIQTMPYSVDGKKVGSHDRVPVYEDVRMQEYVLVTFGYDMISCFCYATPSVGKEFTEEQYAMIDRNGNRTQIYYDVQKANKEILAFDHVMKQFSWQGVFTCDAGKTESDKTRTKNSSFAGLVNRMSLKSIDCLKEVSTSADTLFGYFKDENDNSGFTAVNYNDSSLGLTDDVTFKFDPGYGFDKAVCYVGGEKKVVDVKNNALTLELGVGEGVFVIPYKE